MTIHPRSCECCAGVEPVTPATVENRPGLSALAYRVGTHSAFLESMQAALGGQPALAELTTRSPDDPTLALLDAWAATLDVLSFYQERIANEGFLRTATERRSVLELARRIGYELRPGVAASTTLAFSLQAAPGAPTSAVIPVGTRAQSVPGQGEVPQTFETVEEIEARVEFQSLRPRSSVAVTPVRGTRTLWLQGVDLSLSPGDGLLLVGPEREADPGNDNWDFRLLEAVQVDRSRGLTRVELEYPLGSWTPSKLPSSSPAAFVLRKRFSLFGHNAPDWRAMPSEIKTGYGGTDKWPGFTVGEVSGIEDDDFADGPVHLAGLAPEVVAGSWVVLARPTYRELYKVDAVAEDARTDFTLSSKTARLELEGENLAAKFDDGLRDTVVFGVSEPLTLSEVPLTDLVEGTTVTLSAMVEGLEPGRRVALSGTDVDTGEAVAEVATLLLVDTEDGLTRLTFETPLVHRYAREDADGVRRLSLNANVSPATHGKRVEVEVLGSGDGSRSFQRFTLAQKSLTHVSAATATGTASTLEVRVDGILWEEVPSLYGRRPDDRVYVTRRDDEGATTILFGDGRAGARLPTGVENVTATYRQGLGLDGLVEPAQISLLMTRPLGVKDVLNPEAPLGADDPEGLEGARQNAPLTVLTLDRIVSLQDYQDFAAAFAGIAKARAQVLWSGEERWVHLTVAGVDGGPVPEGSELYANLKDAIDSARQPEHDVVLASYHPLAFGLEARVIPSAEYLEEDVQARVGAALAEAFSFAARPFAQGVTTSEVLAVMQAVEGVVAVDLDRLGGGDPFTSPRLPALPARWEGSAIQPAELLVLDPGAVLLTMEAPA